MAEAEELIGAAEVAARIEDLADRIRPRLRDDAVAVCLLTGGIWFAADLTRALHRRGLDLAFDALWLASYGDARQTSGRIEVHAPLQRPIRGRQALLIDDVLDSGLSLRAARDVLREAGAAEVVTVVFARKPWPGARAAECDDAAWEAPGRFLVGYGMDAAGRGRGRPGIAALDAE